MKTVVFSLYQNKELQRAQFFISQIKNNLSNNRWLYILINDSDSIEFRQSVESSSKYIKVFCKGGNIGVASGRNYLIKKAISDGAEFFISCDNDIIYETNYLEKIEQSYSELSLEDANLGIVQPVLLDGREYLNHFAPFIPSSWLDLYENKDLLGFSFIDIIQKYSTHDKEWLLKSIYHTGTSNVWSAHYGDFDCTGQQKTVLGSEDKERFFTDKRTLRLELEKLLELINTKKYIQVATTAGGVSCFSRKVIEKNGFYNQKFDPFCYEDSEFGFRAYKSDVNNYLLLDIAVIHDPFMAESNRTLMQQANIGRLRGVEISTAILSDSEKSYVNFNSLISCWNEFSSITHKFKTSNEKLSSSLSPEDFTLLFILNYFTNLVFGLFSKREIYPNTGLKEHIAYYLFGGLDNYNRQENIKIPLGLNTNFIIGNFAVKWSNSNNEVFSLRGLNCRLETEGDTLKNSAYFDCYISIRKNQDHCYTVICDLQLDSTGHNYVIDIDIKPWLDNQNYSLPVIHEIKKRNKKYDFGSFSTETIYPRSTITLTDPWVNCVIKQWSRVDELTNKDSLITKAVSSLKNYISGSQLFYEPLPVLSGRQIFGCKLFGLMFRPFIKSNKLTKLQNNPIAFFQDSKGSFTRAIGKLLRII